MTGKHLNSKSASMSLKLPAYFDEELAFEQEIRPLIEQIQAIAIARGMPFVLAVGYGRKPQSGYATGSSVCTVEGRTGAELFVAAKMLSKPAFADLVLELLSQAEEAVAKSLGESTPPPRLM